MGLDPGFFFMTVGSMVLILGGNSEISAQVWSNLCYLICLTIWLCRKQSQDGFLPFWVYHLMHVSWSDPSFFSKVCTGPNFFLKFDPDPGKVHPDPKHCFIRWSYFYFDGRIRILVTSTRIRNQALIYPNNISITLTPNWKEKKIIWSKFGRIRIRSRFYPGFSLRPNPEP